MLGPRLAVTWSATETLTTNVEYIPLVETFQTFFLEDLFDNVSNTLVARVGVISLETCPHDLVGIRSTTSKHLADGAE